MVGNEINLDLTPFVKPRLLFVMNKNDDENKKNMPNPNSTSPAMKQIIHLLSQKRTDVDTCIKSLRGGTSDKTTIGKLGYSISNLKLTPPPVAGKVCNLRINVVNENQEEVITFENFKIDRESYAVYFNDEKYLLPRKEFELLYLLSSKPEKVITREKIMEKVWGADVVVGDRTIDVHIRKLREKFGNKYFKTVKGVGYKFAVN